LSFSIRHSFASSSESMVLEVSTWPSTTYFASALSDTASNLAAGSTEGPARVRRCGKMH
jgi:hypothetical protein